MKISCCILIFLLLFLGKWVFLLRGPFSAGDACVYDHVLLLQVRKLLRQWRNQRGRPSSRSKQGERWRKRNGKTIISTRCHLSLRSQNDMETRRQWGLVSMLRPLDMETRRSVQWIIGLFFMLRMTAGIWWLAGSTLMGATLFFSTFARRRIPGSYI